MPRFNYTGRKKIKRHDLTITVLNNNGILSFAADIDLSDYNLPAEAPVYVEAYRQTSWMRFGYGNAGGLKPETDNRLSEYDSLDGVLFRVKVVEDDGTHGKLLAVADRIRPVKPEEGDAGRLCVLPVKSEEMDCIWRLDFTDDPVLFISKRAGSKDAISRSPEFISLVYPSVLREVLFEIKESDEEWQEDEHSWQKQWVTFVNLLPGVGDMPDISSNDESVYEQWVLDAVESFSRSLDIVGTFVDYHEDGE